MLSHLHFHFSIMFDKSNFLGLEKNSVKITREYEPVLKCVFRCTVISRVLTWSVVHHHFTDLIGVAGLLSHLILFCPIFRHIFYNGSLLFRLRNLFLIWFVENIEITYPKLYESFLLKNVMAFLPYVSVFKC